MALDTASEACGLCRLRAYLCAHKIIRPYRSASSVLQSQWWHWILLGLGPVTLTGFAVCVRTFARVNVHAQIIRCYSPNGVLARTLSKGRRCWCWCCGPGRWCCELADVSWLCALWRCRTLAVQAAYILVPASRIVKKSWGCA